MLFYASSAKGAWVRDNPASAALGDRPLLTAILGPVGFFPGPDRARSYKLLFFVLHSCDASGYRLSDARVSPSPSFSTLIHFPLCFVESRFLAPSILHR